MTGSVRIRIGSACTANSLQRDIKKKETPPTGQINAVTISNSSNKNNQALRSNCTKNPLESTTPPSAKYHITLFKVQDFSHTCPRSDCTTKDPGIQSTYHPLQSTIPPSSKYHIALFKVQNVSHTCPRSDSTTKDPGIQSRQLNCDVMLVKLPDGHGEQTP